jgi:hypothetical protein
VSVVGGAGDVVVGSAVKTVVAVEPVHTAIARPMPPMPNAVIRRNVLISGPYRYEGFRTSDPQSGSK